MSMTTRPPRPRTSEIALLAGAAAWFLLLCNRGINVMDEGVTLLHAFQTARGLVIYRDYLFPITPLSLFIQAGLIKLFGLHLIIGRVYVALEGIILVAAALSIGRRRLEYPFSLIPAGLWVFYTVALGNFPHYNLDAAFFFALCLFALDRWLDRPRTGLLVGAALCAAACILCKQSLAPAALAAVAGAVALAGGGRAAMARRLLLALAVMAASAAPLFVYLAANHALGETWADFSGLGQMKRVQLLVLLPRATVLLAGVVGGVWAVTFAARRRPALWPYAAWALPLAAGAIIWFGPALFAGPLVIAGAATAMLLLVQPAAPADSRPWLLLRGGWLLFFIFTAISGLDLGHMLIASVGAAFPAGLLAQRAFQRGRAVRLAAAFGLAAALATGAWLDLAVPHLSLSQPPRWLATQPIRLPGMELMRTSPEQASELEATVSYIRNHTSRDERIFVYPWDLILYPLADRLPATYHSSFYYEMIDQRALRRVFDDLERVRPRYVVVRMQGDRIFRVAFDSEAVPLEQYLVQRYRVVARFGVYQIMERE